MKLKKSRGPVLFSKNFFELTPGLLFIASIQMPESSAKQAFLKCFNPKFDLIFAFSLNVSPISFGDFILLKLFKLNKLKL